MTDTRDLCTVADVKTLMQKSGINASAQDVLIQTLITRASVKIMRDAGREFIPGGYRSETFTNATRTFEFEKSGDGDEDFVDLFPYDLQTGVVPTIILDSDGTSPITLDTTEYRLWPQPPRDGVYMAIRIRKCGGFTHWRNRQLTVTGNWGFPSVPEDVKQACGETVIHWITSYPAAGGVDQLDSGAPGVTPRSYPMSAVDLLAGYVRQAY